MQSRIAPFLLSLPGPPPHPAPSARQGIKHRAPSYLDRGIVRLARVIETGYIQGETASLQGLFQRLDPRVKLLFLLCFAILISLIRDLWPEIIVGVLIAILALLSRIALPRFYGRVLLLTFFFGFLIALPSALNVITPGHIILPLFDLSRSYDFWIYHIPRRIGFTGEGCLGVSMLSLRVMNSIALASLVLHTTALSDMIKAMRLFRFPNILILIITLSYKYIFIFARTILDMHLARKSRVTGLSADPAGLWVADRMGYLFRRTMMTYEEVFKAMTARGFTGDIKLAGIRSFKTMDLLAGCTLFMIGGFILWL